MDENQVNQQIDQMVRFIQQEASEKASEIKLKADEEFNIEKLRMVEAEKQKIRQEYERKEKQVEVQKRIAQSNEIRYSRLKCLKARDDAMQEVLKEAAGKLPALVSGSSYPALLESLILEALVTLADSKVSVKGVSGQGAATQKALGPATDKFKEWAKKNKDPAFVSAIEITFDPKPLASGIGGVEIAGFGGKITLTNTLQSRLMLAYETRRRGRQAAGGAGGRERPTAPASPHREALLWLRHPLERAAPASQKPHRSPGAPRSRPRSRPPSKQAAFACSFSHRQAPPGAARAALRLSASAPLCEARASRCYCSLPDDASPLLSPRVMVRRKGASQNSCPPATPHPSSHPSAPASWSGRVVPEFLSKAPPTVDTNTKHTPLPPGCRATPRPERAVSRFAPVCAYMFARGDCAPLPVGRFWGPSRVVRPRRDLCIFLSRRLRGLRRSSLVPPGVSVESPVRSGETTRGRASSRPSVVPALLC